MEQITTIGLDLAKQIFQVHVVDADGVPIFNRKLRRAEVLRFFEKTPACLVGMEACGSAHYWGGEIRALGHDVRLIPPVYVRPFVKRGKTDAADAEAISEAVTRKTMRFVPAKSAEQQAAAVVLKTRALLVTQRTQVINALRAHLSEFGIIAAAGTTKVAGLISIVRDNTDERLPKAARIALMEVASQIDALKAQIEKLEQAIVATVKGDDDARRRRYYPRCRRHHRCFHQGSCHSRRLQVRPALRGLARLDAETAFQRRQGAVGAHIEDGQSRVARAPGGWCDRGAAARTEKSKRFQVAHRSSGAAAL